MLQTLFDLLYWRHLTPSGGDTWDCFNLIWTSWRLRLSHYCGAMTQQSPAAAVLQCCSAAVLQTLQNTMTITSCSTFSDVALPEKLQISVCDLWHKRWLCEISFSLWQCKIIHWFSAKVSNKWKGSFHYVEHQNAHEDKYLSLCWFLRALSCLQIDLNVVCWQ